MVKVTDPTGNHRLFISIAFDDNLPVAAVGQCAEPDIAVGFACITIAVDAKPWVCVGACNASPTFDDLFAERKHYLAHLKFAAPTTAQGTQAVGLVERKMP